MSNPKTLRMAVRIFMVSVCLFTFGAIWISPALGSPSGNAVDYSIYLAAATFDPLHSVPALAGALALDMREATAAGVYIVQFNGPVMEAWKQQVMDAGGTLGPYLPNYAFIVRLEPAALHTVQALPFVRWTGPYQPAYKLPSNTDPQHSHTYRVMLSPWADSSKTVQAVSGFALRPARDLTLNGPSAAGQAGTPGGQSLAVDLAGDGVFQTARLADVLWMEPVTLKEKYNDISGGTIMGGTTAWQNGYSGAGVAINVTDSGLDAGTAASIHPDFRGRVANISSWPVVYADYGNGCYPNNGGADDGAADKDSGHGTHVTGSVAGSGAASGGIFKGLAYQSTIHFQAVEQWTEFGSGCWYWPGYYLTGLPIDLAPLFQQAYDWGARVQNDSWGSPVNGAYDVTARDFDDFINKHPDFTTTVAAGNSAFDKDNNGYVDENSMASPGTAKNVITVGASENERASGGYAGFTYGDFGISTTPPTGQDFISDSRGQMAGFSSRGPTLDGRIKPDVVAPGTNIISVRSTQASGTGWGLYDANYMYMGGTSMASPLTAGAAALVREYYIRQGLASPSAALIKATLINSAVDITGYENPKMEAGLPIPNNHEGWGRVDAAAATTPRRFFYDVDAGLFTGAVHAYQFTLAGGRPFKASLVWSDAAASLPAGKTLVNDLNLQVTAPDGTQYLGNRFSGGWSVSGGSADTVNNVENVFIQAPAAGLWSVLVVGQNIPMGPQKFALVVDGLLPPIVFAKASPLNGAVSQPVSRDIAWEPSSDTARYEYCSNTSAACPSGGWKSTGTNHHVVLSRLKANTVYYWQVRAINAAGTVLSKGGWWSFTTGEAIQNFLPSVSP